MSYFVGCDPRTGYFTDLVGVRLPNGIDGSIFILPPNNQCLAIPLPGFQFDEWVGVYTLNNQSSMLTVLNWFGGNYVEGLFTQPWGYNWEISSGSGPYTVQVTDGSYPNGMTPSEDGTSAQGNLIQSGTSPITVQVTDSLGATASVSCDITPPEIIVSCDNPPDAVYGIEYSHQLLASGGTPPYLFGLVGGSLPPGLRIDPLTGIITGTPVSNT